MQHQIDELYKDIGLLSKRIEGMDYTPERKQWILQHKDLIRRRRELIWQINNQ